MDVVAKANDLYIPSNGARLISMTTRKPQKAIIATEAKAEVKDKDGKLVSAEVKAVKGRVAKTGMVFMKIAANNETMLKELANRLAIEGVLPKEDAKIEPHHSGVTMVFEHENQAAIRIALKMSKGKGEHNAKGLAIEDGAQKLKAQAKKEKVKEEEKAKGEKAGDEKTPGKEDAKKAPAAKATAKKATAKKATAKAPAKKEDEWPS